jgi:hypothetical protein
MMPDAVCPNGHQNPPTAKFCRSCGLPISASVENRTDVTQPFVPEGPLTHPNPVATNPPYNSADAVLDPQGVPYQSGVPSAHEPETPGRKMWPIIVIAVLVLLVLGLGAAFAATALTKKSPSASSSGTSTASSSAPATSSPTISIPTTTTISAAQQEAQALSTLLSNSAVDRAQIVSAVQQITSCGNLSGAQETLDQAATSRQNLLGQLNQLQLGALPNGIQLLQSLQAAWQASLGSDNAYAAYAGDELSNFNGCTQNDSGDSNAQAAATSDAEATAAKNQFVGIWNPIASTYGFTQWQASNL